MLIEQTDEQPDTDLDSDVSEDIVNENENGNTGGEEDILNEDATFFDPKGLSEELQPAYKQMQAAFTKKTQGIADVRKKSEAFDNLLKDEKFRNWAREQSNTEQSGEDENSELSPQDKKIAQLEKSIHDIELEKVASKHPDFDKYLSKIEAYVKRGFSYDEAYTQAKAPNLKDDAKQELIKETKARIDARKKANIDVGTSSLDTSGKSPKTFKEAYAQAKAG